VPVISPRLRIRRPAFGKSGFAPSSATNDRLSDLAGVKSNPGSLRARCYVPKNLPANAPLVVVLHGCTQDAAVYDHGSGWSTLADRHGFALLYPEQVRANNPMLCFNWFSSGDIRRGTGEAASIAAMVETMQRSYGLDPARTFVTGLSAGGAMTSVMLATHPEMFAAGAILAGVAYGCADSVGEAFECMNGHSRSDGGDLAAPVRRASRHKGPWPRVQVWQGSADRTVVPSNADAIVRQWAQLHDLRGEADRHDEVEGYPRRAWLDASGEPLIEHISVTGMAHGVPLAGKGDEAVGQAGAHMLDVGLSSTHCIAGFFGIAEARPAGKAVKAAPAARPREEAKPEPRAQKRPARAVSGPQAVIEKALRAAGLMR
jgi:poly(hydroxyalkanoate) depolymerase family esterase